MKQPKYNYYELRKYVSKMVPRKTHLFRTEQMYKKPIQPKTKGRKSSYKEFQLTKNCWRSKENLLNLEEISSFIEVSCRAAACPMPFNADVWDGIRCPFGCIYCFAFTFKSYLYTAFFDNVANMGVRHCNPNKFKRELDKLMKLRGRDPHTVKSAVAKAACMNIPLHFGIRFEDFIRQEAKAGVSLELLKYLADNEYPVMVNTKSDLIGEARYVKALARNKAKAAVHFTLISSNDKLLKILEPGAPSYAKRLKAIKALVQGGVRVVARIEPLLIFITDEKSDVQKYIEDMWNAGVRHITFDTYSYTAKSPSIYQKFTNVGMDLERIMLVGCDSQALGSLLLDAYMDLFRKRGFSCSTFDMGNVPNNSQDVCCEVGDWFQNCGWNWGSVVMAIRYIQRRGNNPTNWRCFETFVNERGGFLSEGLKNDMHHLWNCDGALDAYSPSWARGLKPVDYDKHGLIWTYNDDFDFRHELYKLINI